jgi:hypothetical protein
LAIARKHRSQLTGENASYSAKSAFGAATSSANNQYAKATDDAQLKAEDEFNSAICTWSDVRIHPIFGGKINILTTFSPA